jgi:CHAT domain
MSNRQPIVNISGDYEESLIQLSRHLGTNKIRRQLFGAVYGRGEKAKSKKQLMRAAGIFDVNNSNSQQAQNELDHLFKHHLITRVNNEGQVEDRSRYLFGKDPTVRANREKIVAFADNPRRAEMTATKRSPVISPATKSTLRTRSTLKRMKKLTVLYLTSNPYPDHLKGTADAFPLRVDLEVRRVQDAIRRSIFKDNVDVQYRPAADLQSIMDGLNDHRPQVVHFSGHSDNSEIAFDDQMLDGPDFVGVEYQLLSKALGATDFKPRVLVLNSCSSIAAADEINKTIDVLIGMSAPISDVAASTFAPQFYAALASGQSILSAFNQAKVCVENVTLNEQDTIQMSLGNGINPSLIKLV